jgi:DivIVA domain-containing protein
LALDRQSIEKRDFPIARRGYDPAAVDAHLALVAAEVVNVQREAAGAGSGVGAESLASAASEQVRAIVDAAERSAAEIERQAQEAARRTDEQARSDAERTRQDAIERAQEHVGNVSQATNLMLQRVDAMESELGALVESLRTGANRLSADLALLEGNMSELYGAAAAGTMPPERDLEELAVSAEPEPVPMRDEPKLEELATPPEPVEEALAAVAPDDESTEPGRPDEELLEPGRPHEEPAEPAPPTRVSETPPAEQVATEPLTAGSSADAEGARLIALNMALNGQSREETERYLAENFDLADRARLLDEVYSSLE